MPVRVLEHGDSHAALGRELLQHKPITAMPVRQRVGPLHLHARIQTVALGYNHFPVAQVRCDGRWIKMLDKPSHVSSSPISDPVLHENGNREFWNGLYGMNRMSMKELVNFGRSWAYPSEMSMSGSGFASLGYDRSQRCYQVERREPGGGPLEITLQGTKDSPIVNPAIRIKNWNVDSAKVLVNGKLGDEVRLGFHHGIEGTDLVLFALINETAPLKLTITK